MTPVAVILRDEISTFGAVPFRRFMEVALYHPEHGYYRRARDPFGVGGDYYTAEQLQPVFGVLIAARVRSMFQEMGSPPDFSVVELGAGRGEMAQAFSAFPYYPVDSDRDEWPDEFTGVVFSNEFFDALPVHVAVRRGKRFREVRVDWKEERFVWVEGDTVSGEVEAYLERYAGSREEGDLVEVNLDALGWIERVARRLRRGYVFTIDYGYTERESVRFRRGTLMAYHRHTAVEDVLADPGARDITAHVCFSALEQRGASRGLETIRFESLARTLLEAGETDQFAAAVAGTSEEDGRRRRLQLKTLLYGMGETFRVLIQRTEGPK